MNEYKSEVHGSLIFYLESHRRKPVCYDPLLPHMDAQGAVPAGWCPCGGEIYRPGEVLCLECRKEKQNESVVSCQSVSVLYQGLRS